MNTKLKKSKLFRLVYISTGLYLSLSSEIYSGNNNNKTIDFADSDSDKKINYKKFTDALRAAFYDGPAKQQSQSKNINDFPSPMASIPTEALPTMEQLFNNKIPNKIKLASDMLSHPEQMPNDEAQLKNCILLYGPPGTGKTTIAEVLARQTDRKVLFANGGQFINEYQGSGAKGISELFKVAIEYKKPVVIVIDEVDGAASSIEKGHYTNEESRTLKALLTALDANLSNPNIFVVCTTNYINKLEKSALSRLASIKVDYPSKDVRKKIINYYFEKNGVAVESAQTNSDLAVSASFFDKLVASTDKFSARDIKDIINDAVAYTIKGYNEENKMPFFFKPWYSLWNITAKTPTRRSVRYDSNKQLLEKHLYSKLVEMQKKHAENNKAKTSNYKVYGLAALGGLLATSLTTSIINYYFTENTNEQAKKVGRYLIAAQALLGIIGGIHTVYSRDVAANN